MVILYEFVDLIKVIRIKMDALDAEVPFDRFSKELRFICVGLGDFVSVLQGWIVTLTLAGRRFTPVGEGGSGRRPLPP